MLFKQYDALDKKWLCVCVSGSGYMMVAHFISSIIQYFSFIIISSRCCLYTAQYIAGSGTKKTQTLSLYVCIERHLWDFYTIHVFKNTGVGIMLMAMSSSSYTLLISLHGPWVTPTILYIFAHLVDLFKHHLELDLTFALQYNLYKIRQFLTKWQMNRFVEQERKKN